jgi:hypothetical protein
MTPRGFHLVSLERIGRPEASLTAAGKMSTGELREGRILPPRSIDENAASNPIG